MHNISSQKWRFLEGCLIVLQVFGVIMKFRTILNLLNINQITAFKFNFLVTKVIPEEYSKAGCLIWQATLVEV